MSNQTKEKLVKKSVGERNCNISDLKNWKLVIS